MRFSSALLASTALCTLPFLTVVNSAAVSLESRSLRQPAVFTLAERSNHIESRIDFLSVSAGELELMLRNGSTTSVELINAYLARSAPLTSPAHTLTLLTLIPTRPARKILICDGESI